MSLLPLIQSISTTTTTSVHDFGLLILGIIVLALGIILGHFFPSRYWIILIAVGVIIIVIWAIIFLLGFVALIAPLAFG